MELESFEDVTASMQKNRDRSFHLLLGNGFSMAYDPEIFSYNALHDFISGIDNTDLKTILQVVETKNFELIMQQLDTFSALVGAFGTYKKLKRRIDVASAKLKQGLLEAVKALHPEHVFTIPEEQSVCCAKFLKSFLDSKGKIFSTNYDLLLYWVLLRNNVISHIDGFGREQENPGEFVPADEQIWSELRWGKHREEQNVFYVHGALPLFDTGIEIVKEEYDQRQYLLEKISSRMDAGEYPIFVAAGDGSQKLAHIMHNKYLTFCYDNLCNITGSLVTFGFNFGPYDEHVIEAINRAAKYGKKDFPKLCSIYIGVYSDEDRQHIQEIQGKFRCKVHLYDARTAEVWGARET